MNYESYSNENHIPDQLVFVEQIRIGFKGNGTNKCFTFYTTQTEQTFTDDLIRVGLDSHFRS